MTDQPQPNRKRKRNRRGRGGKGGGGSAPAVATTEPQQAKQKVKEFNGKTVVKEVTVYFDERIWEIFLWMCGGSEANAETLATNIVRANVIKRQPEFREAKGIVSHSSRNAEFLASNI